MIGRNAVLLPMFSGYYQDRVTNGLSRQTGSCGTKRHWQTVTVSKSQQVGNLLFAVGTNHDLWDKAVETRICSPCQPAQFVGIYPILRNKSPYFLQKRSIATFYHSVFAFLFLIILFFFHLPVMTSTCHPS